MVQYHSRRFQIRRLSEFRSRLQFVSFSANCVCPTSIISRPPTPRTGSESPDDAKNPLSQTQPVVPARLKKAAARYRKMYPPPGEPHSEVQNNRQSLIEQSTLADQQCSGSSNSSIASGLQFDSVDCRLTMSSKGGDGARYQMKTCANLIPKEHKILRSHNTFSATCAPDNSHQTNFQRQNQVNRKHGKQSQSQTDGGTSAAVGRGDQPVSQSKVASKLTRSNDRVIPKIRSRSQSKLGETVPPTVPRMSRQVSKTVSQYNAESFSSESNDSRRDRHPSPERRRSSSACRVPKLKEQYESNLVPRSAQQPPPLPLKRTAYLADNSANVSRLIKDIEDSKMTRSRNLARQNRPRNNNGPVRSIQNAQQPQVDIATVGEQQDKSKLHSFLSNKSLNERLYDSNDDDVTFI